MDESRTDQSQPGEPQLDAAIRQLREGRVVAAATESFFGLLADASNPAALNRLFEVKARESSKGVGLMAPSLEAWLELVEPPAEAALRLAAAHWPGPLSIVAPARSQVDPRLCVGGTLSVRVPGPCIAARLIERFGRAVTATSANLAGEPPCRTSAEVEAAFESASTRGDLLVVKGQCPGGQVSTLVSLEEGQIRLLRAGAIAEDLLKKTVASIIG